MPQRERAFIGVGANLGDRRATIERAIQAIDGHQDIDVVAVSSMHETVAETLRADQVQPDYLNGAIAVETSLAPENLLEVMLDIERSLGRDRLCEERWASRTIDLDLLLFADVVIEQPGLIVPHPQMAQRRFVLAPLAEIAADARHPILHRSIAQLLSDLPDELDCNRRRMTRSVTTMIALAASLLTAQVRAQVGDPTESGATTGLSQAVDRLHALAAAARESSSGEVQEVVITALQGERKRRTHVLLAPGRAVLFPEVGLLVEGNSYWIWSRTEPRRVVFEVVQTGEPFLEALKRLPPTPLPTLRFAEGDDDLSDLAPLWASMTWQDGGIDGAGFHLLARSGRVAARVEDMDGRPPLDLVTSSIQTARGSLEFTVQSRRVAADALDLPDDLADRRPVGEVRELMPREGTVGEGDRADSLVLLTAQSTPWSRLGDLAAGADGHVLLIMRTTDPWFESVRPMLHSLATIEWNERLGVRPVLVLSEDLGDLPAVIADLVDEWGSGLLWSVSPETSIDQIAPDATCVALVIDSDGVVRSITPIEKRTTDIEPIVRAIEQALGF